MKLKSEQCWSLVAPWTGLGGNSEFGWKFLMVALCFAFWPTAQPLCLLCWELFSSSPTNAGKYWLVRIPLIVPLVVTTCKVAIDNSFRTDDHFLLHQPQGTKLIYIDEFNVEIYRAKAICDFLMDQWGFCRSCMFLSIYCSKLTKLTLNPSQALIFLCNPVVIILFTMIDLLGFKA